MWRLKRWLCLAFAACLLEVVAAPAVAKIGTHRLTFSTGQFAVNCTSTGQLCSPPELLRFHLSRAGTLIKIVYTTPATHCSAVVLHVLRHGHQIAKTKRLPAGMGTATVATKIKLGKGSTTLAFQAQGFVGGCNVGRVFSWGGKVTITVKVSG